MEDTASAPAAPAPKELTPADLICRCGVEELPQEIDQHPEALLPGQARGTSALEAGLDLKKRWFNITVTGAPGSGKTTAVQQLVQQRAVNEPPGLDICLHQNFANPQKPGVLYLPPGQGTALNHTIDILLKELDKQVPALLEQPSIKAQLQQLRSLVDQEVAGLTREIEDYAVEQQVVVQSTPQGVNLIPMAQGRPMKEEEYLSLTPGQRKHVDDARQNVMKRMAEVNPKILALEKRKRDSIEEFIEKTVRELVQLYMQELYTAAEHQPRLTAFLASLEEELVEKRFLFLSDSSAAPFGGAQFEVMRQYFAKTCKLNVMVNRGGETAAPVVTENHPNYSNLIGGINFIEEHGVLKSDFMQVRAGSLLQASGGYLVVQAHELVQQPIAYAALKRALRYSEIKLRDQISELGFRSGINLEPEAVRVNAKVIIIGDEYLIQLITSLDDEFARLFKINADFSRTLERSPDVIRQFVAYLTRAAAHQALLPFAPSGMTRIVEEASRRVAHQGRLSAQINELVDTLIEADQVAREHNQGELDRAVINEAVERKRYRHGKIEEQVKREISAGTILLNFEGSAIGQVNGLAVYQVGRVAFGVPTRITAQAYAGRSGIINIEREADLSGRIHTKGVLILGGYLGQLFAQNEPLALSVSIAFEQNYGVIDGDSATAAEFFATLSTIAQVPLRQNLAVTGSMNQHGEIQPIGGVNEKVSGFFQFAKEHDFPVGCGVIIPATNRVNLMLDEEVISAVEAGKFHIFPISRAEEGLELLTGLLAGKRDAEGNFTPGSVYHRAEQHLEAFMRAARDNVDKDDDEGADRRKPPGAPEDEEQGADEELRLLP